MTTFERRVPVPPGARDAPGPPGAPGAGGGPLRRPATPLAAIVVVVLVRWRPAARPWGWMRLVLQGFGLAGVGGLRFAKVLGSGAEGGFGLKPSGRHQGLFLAFDGEAAARDFIAASPVLAAYRAHADELCVALLQPASCRGSWSGRTLTATTTLGAGEALAALTRASIRPRHALAFWRLSPPAEASLAAAPGCRLAAGLGEAPLLRQATFSLWDDAASMDAYARSGAHQQAITAAYGGGYFSEAMFARFRVLALEGRWQGLPRGA